MNLFTLARHVKTLTRFHHVGIAYAGPTGAFRLNLIYDGRREGIGQIVFAKTITELTWGLDCLTEEKLAKLAEIWLAKEIEERQQTFLRRQMEEDLHAEEL